MRSVATSVLLAKICFQHQIFDGSFCALWTDWNYPALPHIQRTYANDAAFALCCKGNRIWPETQEGCTGLFRPRHGVEKCSILLIIICSYGTV